MGIGEQIRTLQARTETAYNELKIINNRKVATGRTTCTFWEQRGNWTTIKPVSGRNWCTCASACFLVWSSGLTRGGGRVGLEFIDCIGPEVSSAIFRRRKLVRAMRWHRQALRLTSRSWTFLRQL